MKGFCDYRRVILTGGHGGHGCIAFSKLLNQPFGPPNGGNGGRAGNVIVKATKNVTTLEALNDRYIVPNGGNGKGKFMHGADGADIVLQVPIGTVINEISLDQLKSNHLKEQEPITELDKISQHFFFRKGYEPMEDRVKMLVERVPRKKKRAKITMLDLTLDGQTEMVFRGGRGGFGNPHFRSPQIQGPGIAEYGEIVESFALDFELKTIADVGLIGLPNAGKSTLLKAISNARPKIANYPFTTLNPYVGTIEFEDFQTITVADMPGIIKGAHQNYGLGHKFLRHIERTKMFVFVLDFGAKDPWQDYQTLLMELELYNPGLSERRKLIVANKADIEIARSNLDKFKLQTSDPIIPISAIYERNIHQLTNLIRSALGQD